MLIALGLFYIAVETLLWQTGTFLALSTDDPLLLEQMRTSTPFSVRELIAFGVFYVIFALALIVLTFLFLRSGQDRFRMSLKGVLAVDVFLSLAVLIYYARIGYRPLQAGYFYWGVFLTIVEIALIIGLSSPPVILYTRLTRDSAEENEQNS